MKSSYFIPSLTLVGLCMWTLDLFGAEASSWDATTPPREVLTVGRRNVSIGSTALSNEFVRSELSAMNLTGIRYAKGKGVERNPRMAMRFFLRSAMKGYTPAMANVGTLYEIGAAGSPNLYRAYAWVRTALFFGVPEQDHDATVLKWE